MSVSAPRDGRSSRRQFLGRSLRGAGGAAIGLPFLLSREGSTRAGARVESYRLAGSALRSFASLPCTSWSAGCSSGSAPFHSSTNRS